MVAHVGHTATRWHNSKGLTGTETCLHPATSRLQRCLQVCHPVAGTAKSSARQRKRMAPENIGLPSVLGHAPSKHGHTARIAHLPVPRYLHSDRPTLPPWPCCTARPFRHQSSALSPAPSIPAHATMAVCKSALRCLRVYMLADMTQAHVRLLAQLRPPWT